MDLAANGTESEGIEEAAVADAAGIGGGAFPGARLRAAALIQKHDFRAVDNVGLDASDIQKLLNLPHSDHVVVRRSPYLRIKIQALTRQNRSARGEISAIGDEIPRI